MELVSCDDDGELDSDKTEDDDNDDEYELDYKAIEIWTAINRQVREHYYKHPFAERNARWKKPGEDLMRAARRGPYLAAKGNPFPLLSEALETALADLERARADLAEARKTVRKLEVLNDHLMKRQGERHEGRRDQA